MTDYAFSHTPGCRISSSLADDPADWLKPMCAAWASQWRRVYGSIDDGWPAISLLGMLTVREDQLGKRSGLRQGFAEVFTGDALLINRGLDGAPWQNREIIAAHYLVQRIKYQARADRLEISLKQYFIRLGQAHHYLAGRLKPVREIAPPG